MAFDLSDDPTPFAAPRRRGMVLLGASALMAVALGAAFFWSTDPVSTSAVAAAAPVAAPEAPKSHAYDPGNEPIHLREAPPPLQLTTREVSPPAPTTHAAAPRKAARATAPRDRTGTRSGPIGFKATGKGSKYDPLNGAL